MSQMLANNCRSSRERSLTFYKSKFAYWPKFIVFSLYFWWVFREIELKFSKRCVLVRIKISVPNYGYTSPNIIKPKENSTAQFFNYIANVEYHHDAIWHHQSENGVANCAMFHVSLKVWHNKTYFGVQTEKNSSQSFDLPNGRPSHWAFMRYYQIITVTRCIINLPKMTKHLIYSIPTSFNDI